MTATLLAVPDSIEQAIEAVRSPDTPIDDKIALYAYLYAFQREINRALGIRQKGPTAQHEITEHLTRSGLQQVGPVYIGWEAYDVEYPCNAADQWGDESIQSGMRALRDDPTTREYVREIPAHLEIDVPALGKAIHDGSVRARALFDELKERKWRTEGGKRAVLKVREVRAPKKGKAA